MLYVLFFILIISSFSTNGVMYELADKTNIISFTNIHDISYNNDGSKIIFISDYDIDNQNTNESIWVVDCDGNNLSRITSNNNYRYPAINNEGTKIISRYANKDDFCLMNVNGTNEKISKEQIGNGVKFFIKFIENYCI